MAETPLGPALHDDQETIGAGLAHGHRNGHALGGLRIVDC